MSDVYRPRYIPTEADRPLCEQFRRRPFGPHGPELSRLLNRLRWEPLEGKYVLVCFERNRQWTVARLPGKLGRPIKLLPALVFSSREDAEWAVFRLRWKRVTGVAYDDEPLDDGEIDLEGRITVSGYADRLSLRAGDEIAFMVSCDDGASSFRSRLVRLICGDDHPDGPGFKVETVPSAIEGRHPGQRQRGTIGSYCTVPADEELRKLTSFTVSVAVWPTAAAGNDQGLVSIWRVDRSQGFALVLDEGGAACLVIGDSNGGTCSISTEVPLELREWHIVSASFDAATGTASVRQSPVVQHGSLRQAAAAACTCEIKPAIPNVPLLFAALCASASAAEVISEGHFNGRLDSPLILAEAVDLASLDQPMLKGGVSPELRESTVGSWDFGIGIAGFEIWDSSGNNRHGKTVNLPTRGVKGVRWSGRHFEWQLAPSEYSAIHFHDDDFLDAEWKESLRFRTPPELGSGVYALHIETSTGEDYVPFFVRPSRGAKTAAIALLMPTATYLAYANNHAAYTEELDEMEWGQLVELQWSDVHLNSRRDLGLSTYDTHSDGSGVPYSSFRRPILTMRPKGRLWNFNADLHIVDWLEAMKLNYDVITDEDLHREGREALRGYRVVLTGTHPEYASREMIDALHEYTATGGRLVYMGGNGFYWRIAFNPQLSGVIECRKSEGVRSWEMDVAERRHSFDGEMGGLWRSLGRPPQRLVGVGTAAFGFVDGCHYRVTLDPRDTRFAFVFAGVDTDRPIGAFGRFGGGAAAGEIDRYDRILGSPPNCVVLASAAEFSRFYMLSPEEVRFLHPAMSGDETTMVRADMVIFDRPGGGAVFSVGSVGWAAALGTSEYQNDVSRITKNVIDRFLDPTPI